MLAGEQSKKIISIRFQRTYYVHAEVLKVVNFSDRGQKTANFHVLRKSNIPALLTENGFIDNINDANKLKTSAPTMEVCFNIGKKL